MEKQHKYTLDMEWRGNLGQGTTTYEGYSRKHIIRIKGKPDLIATADVPFRGDPTLHNPEDHLLAALSGCHLLTYLALCARARINVISYRDHAEGTLLLTKDGGGHFSDIVLQPEVVVAEEAMLEKARYFHGEVHKYCFIARSVNFPVRCEANVRAT
ncbi:MAG TPA: OsmC family protein [Flavobacteriales bacterium]|jgi:organic hydroperoxide reductase OsmC/OhrA|nr:OsmC family protein [Flavobacteriales bacterium]MBK7111322.1 OsmC family protein [Flavobacteriales bacterium]MBK7618176.1 OsmC family protein [Flavobacteriales bacterium]MBK8533044.1 OsmC family protein [Flavobacteriales bacterium]MBK8707483.1 OsmC family protein [Flavobacteriales bacterium]